jgi:hypothetical protein
MLTVGFITLHCNVTEDWTGPDEPYLMMNGQVIWDHTREGLNDGGSAHIGIELPLNGIATVSLFDQDSPDPDDFLGSIAVFPQELGPDVIKKKFLADGADYWLSYRVFDK